MSAFKQDLYLTPKDAADLLSITPQAVHKSFKELKLETLDTYTKHHKIRPDVMRKFMDAKGYKIPKSIMVFHVCKGGVGKTTSALATATRLASFGCRVLIIDLDQQGNCTESLGVPLEYAGYPTMLDVVVGKFRDKPITIEDAIMKDIGQNLHLIPSNLVMSKFDATLQADTGYSPDVFKTHINKIINNYDVIIFDAPPQISRVTMAAHLVADMALMPIELDPYSLQGLELNFEHIRKLHQNFNKELQVKIFINKHNSRPKIDFDIADHLAKSDYKKYLCESVIRLSSKFKEAASSQTSIWSASKNNPAVEDFNSLVMELFGLKEAWAKKTVVKPQHIQQPEAQL